MKILVDLPASAGLTTRVTIGTLLDRADEPFAGAGDRTALTAFLADRLAYVLEQRGFDVRAVRAVLHGGVEAVSPLEARLKLEALSQLSGSAALLGVAALLKRVKNITRGITVATSWSDLEGRLVEPSERALWSRMNVEAPRVREAAAKGDYRDAFTAIAGLQPAVAAFFDDVLVMAEDVGLREARLSLVAALRDLILEMADISEIAAEETR